MAIVAYYRMNGNSNDASGNGINGSGVNVSYANSYGRINKGVNLPGSSVVHGSEISFNHNAVFLFNDFTISFHFKKIGNWSGTNFNRLFDKAYGTGFQIVRWDISNKLLFYALTDNVASNTVISPDKWYYIVCSRSGANGFIWIDGKLDGSGSFSNNQLTSTAKLYFGCAQDGNNFNCSYNMDEVVFDNTAWNAARQKNQYSHYKGFF
jgi:hypothetical protein